MKNEFLEYAVKSNRIRPLGEAFDEFPPEEENHKGNYKFYLEEESAEYYKYKIGDIVFVRNYKYQNGTIGKAHLFVIVEMRNIAMPIEYLSMLISSKTEKIKFSTNKLLEIDETNNLKKDSIVKTDVIYSITDEDILMRIGEVNIKNIEEYKKYFMNKRSE